MAIDDITSTLPRLLSTVKRPGEFFATGAIDLPVIRAHVDGLGGLGLPIPLTHDRERPRHCVGARRVGHLGGLDTGTTAVVSDGGPVHGAGRALDVVTSVLS